MFKPKRFADHISDCDIVFLSPAADDVRKGTFSLNSKRCKAETNWGGLFQHKNSPSAHRNHSKMHC